MTKKMQTENIVKVKTALADKYERLARTRSSKPGKKTLLHHANRFRSQAANIAKSNSR
jgi:2-polyprenyl-3-methyl-5-hydroxy-6-metoxy-1,4-benzoquinol methylase